jgi:hypothetical protein
MLAARLPEGQLLFVWPHAFGWPLRRKDGSLEEGQPPPRRWYDLWIYDSSGRRAQIDYYEDDSEPEMLRLSFIEIRTADGAHEIWSSRLSFDDEIKRIWDYRYGNSTVERRPMLETDRTMYIFPVPSFGECDLLWERVLLYLENEGFGPLT